nr:MAG TPA: HeH/LEM domain [Herelleviridae sp.]
MKLFDKKIGNQTVNFNGRKVTFVNSVAEVDDSFGAEILKMGFADLYELGKQPVYETPKEIQMKTDFSEKEEWYKGECSRLRNIADSRKKQVEDLESEVKLWKEEYEKEKAARLALVENLSRATESAPEVPDETEPEQPKNEEQSGEEEVVDEAAPEETSDEALREELASLKKDELLAFAKDNGLEIDGLEKRTKADIIEFIVESTK